MAVVSWKLCGLNSDERFAETEKEKTRQVEDIKRTASQTGICSVSHGNILSNSMCGQACSYGRLPCAMFWAGGIWLQKC
jgi:hypothetical protein